MKARQDNIDLLRAVAIVAVLVFHYTTRFPELYGGQTPFRFPVGAYGVDLFFTVSGFCIFMTLDSSRSLENFWARRLARIQPAYMAAILVTFAVVWIFGLPGRAVSLPIALSNMLWLNALPGWPMVDSAYWSLVVELKFYLWIGIIYYLMAGRNISLAWAGFSILGFLGTFVSQQASDALVIGSFAPAFLAGLLAWEWRKIEPRLRVGLAGLTLLLLAMSPRYAAFPWTGVVFCALGFLVLRAPWLRVPRPITFIGLISYSLYLLHQNIGYVIIRAVPYGLFIAPAVVIALAALFYWAVERRWERLALRWIETTLTSGRRFLPLPRRNIPHGSLETEMRAW